MNNPAYDLFISYQSSNLALAEAIHARLVQEGFRVWFDKARLNAGCNWHAEIEAGCKASRILLPILTPAWQSSEWTKFETYGAEFVIPLLCEGKLEEVTPLPLREYQGIDFRQPDESTWDTLLTSIRQYLSQAPPEKTNRLACVPYAHNPYFVGREKELLELHEKLSRAPSTVLTQGAVQAVAGMGGIGKTTLAREYAEKFWRQYRNILWVRAEQNLVLEFQRLAEEMGLIRERSKDAEIDARMALRELSSRTRRLLILDNAPDEEAIQEWIPTTGDCRTIITSRFAGWSAAVQTLHVYVLDPEPARELLLKRSGLPDTEANRVGADRVAQELGYLPLSLEHAAAYVGEAHQTSFDQYLAYYTEAKSRRDLLARRVLGSTQYPDSVATTWLITVQRLSPLARAILTLISFLAPNDIPQSLVIEAGDFLRAGLNDSLKPEWNSTTLGKLYRKLTSFIQGVREPQAQANMEITKYSLEQSLVELKRYSMITLRPEYLSVHRLVQAVQRDGLDKPALNRWAERAVQMVEQAFPKVEFENWPICEQLVPHVLVCANFIKQLDLKFLEAIILLNSGGYYLTHRGRYEVVESLYQQALEICHRKLGEQHPAYATGLQNLAALYDLSGNYTAAEPLLKQALEIWRSALGEQHLSYATSLNNLAELYRNMGNYTAAEPLLKQALEIWRSALGEQHPDYALGFNNLGDLYRIMGNYTAAEPLLKQALEIRRSTLGEQHPDYAASLHNLAELYRNMGNYTAAEPLLKQALEIWRSTLGEQHPDYAASLNNLALLYNSIGDNAQAEPLFQLAREIWHKVLGDQHPNYALSLLNLAVLYKVRGNYAAAEPLLKQALEIWRSTLGEQHPDYAASLHNLAELYRNMGNYTAAEPLLKQALEIWRSALGEQHPNYALSLEELAMLYEAMGNYAAAEPLLKQALEIRRSTLGELYPDYARDLNNLGSLLMRLGEDDNIAEAEQHLRRAVQIDTALPYPHYWLAKLYQKRSNDGDLEHEIAEWKRYLELGPTSEERRAETIARLDALHSNA